MEHIVMNFNPAPTPQAGGIAYRIENGVPRVMLVQAKKNPSHWIFPKGHIELGESEESAALRELVEEAGIEGEIVTKAGHLSYMRAGIRYNVAYFLIRFSAEAGEGETGRTPTWFAREDALARLPFPEMRELLLSVQEKMG
jgi:8-oxo-dGTP pyrophosphatase MutT (NUDIX family)